MGTFAVIRNSVVDNIVEGESLLDIQSIFTDAVLVEVTPNTTPKPHIGHGYDGHSFEEPMTKDSIPSVVHYASGMLKGPAQ
jgi:hypothetical protein